MGRLAKKLFLLNYFKTESINEVIRFFEERFRDRNPGGMRVRNWAERGSEMRQTAWLHESPALAGK